MIYLTNQWDRRLAIFGVSMIVLFAFYMVSTNKATGPWWYQAKGIVVIYVGVMYVVFGTFLPTWNR